MRPPHLASGLEVSEQLPGSTQGRDCKNHTSRPNPRTVLQGSPDSSCLALESPEEPASNEMETGGFGQSRKGTEEPQGLVVSIPESSETGGAGPKTGHLSCLSPAIAENQTWASLSHSESRSLAETSEMESFILVVLL